MTKCGRHGPDTSNVCTTDRIGQGDTRNYNLPRFCAPKNNFFSATDTRRTFCRRIGGGGEWDYQREGPSNCNYDMEDDKSGYSIPSGCCNISNCGVIGAGAVCQRVAYRGNPITCCFRDQAYNQANQYCFESKSEERTCPLEFRDMTDDGCQDIMINYCTAQDITTSTNDWINTMNTRWNPTNAQSCQYVLNRNLFGNPNTPGLTSGVPLNPNLFTNNEGFRYSQRLMNAVFDEYADKGFQIGAVPGYPGYADFQDNYIFPICSTIPGLCESSLNNICGTVTTNELINEPQLVPWCGCYMNDIEYSQYVNEFEVNKECTPMCTRQGNIPVANLSGFGVLPCKQSLCIIDNVTISLEQSNVGGSINFSQFCGACSGPSQGSATSSSGSITDGGAQASESVASCRCIINDVNIDTASSEIGGGIDLTQICGANAECYRPNPNGNPPVLSVPCDAPPNVNPNDNPQNEIDRLEAEAASFRRTVIIVLVILGIIALLIILYIISLYGNDTKPKVIYPAKDDVDKYALQALLAPQPPPLATQSITQRNMGARSNLNFDAAQGSSGSLTANARVAQNFGNIGGNGSLTANQHAVQNFNNIGGNGSLLAGNANHHQAQDFGNIGSGSLTANPHAVQNFNNIGGNGSLTANPHSVQNFGGIGSNGSLTANPHAVQNLSGIGSNGSLLASSRAVQNFAGIGSNGSLLSRA